jgi:hypothetical protein
LVNRRLIFMIGVLSSGDCFDPLTAGIHDNGK